ncbi:MAG: AraC family transcriptional regulator [Sphingobacteriales bacterium]|nr:MAG: AraC family transcriptional regulator [Sphingobacteriales bacterium]
MTTTCLQIKNMCCDRCIEVVRNLLQEAGYNPVSVAIGEAAFVKDLSANDIENIRRKLKSKGFAIAEKSNEKVTVKIHAAICGYLGQISNKEPSLQKLSAYLSEKLHQSYYQLSRRFTETTGVTIEKYFICLRMEKAKELLMHDELSITEIAWQLGYSTQQIFSTQFKKETGKTPGEYRLNPIPKRIHWDKLLWQHFKQNA